MTAKKKPVTTTARPPAAKAKRFTPRPWTKDDTEDLQDILAPYVSVRRNRIPANRRSALVKNASRVLAAQIQAVRSASAPSGHRRKLADLAAMRKACDRLLNCWASTETKEWIWLACKVPHSTPPGPMAQVRRHIKKHTRDSWMYYDREEHAVIPADREECLISIPSFFVHDLRRLSLALHRAEVLTRGVRPRKAAAVGGVLGELYDVYRRDTGLKPSIHGPFRDVAEFAVSRVLGEQLGERILADRLRVLHAVSAFTRWDPDPDLTETGGFVLSTASASRKVDR